MQFSIEFNGRLAGALGVTYPIKATVEAIDEEGARLALYERYEHILVRSVRALPTPPAGFVEVTQAEFFKALKADPRDIMPSARLPYETPWEDRARNLWGWTDRGWQSPYSTSPERYYIRKTN